MHARAPESRAVSDESWLVLEHGRSYRVGCPSLCEKCLLCLSYMWALWFIFFVLVSFFHVVCAPPPTCILIATHQIVVVHACRKLKHLKISHYFGAPDSPHVRAS